MFTKGGSLRGGCTVPDTFSTCLWVGEVEVL